MDFQLVRASILYNSVGIYASPALLNPSSLRLATVSGFMSTAGSSVRKLIAIKPPIAAPRNTVLMNPQHFSSFGDGKIIINTSLGLAFDVEDFNRWIAQPGNYGIFDGDGGKELSSKLQNRNNVIYQEKSAGWSSQTLVRLSKKTLQNLVDYCEEK